jgi:tripartite-type tricarboxylate transporter receptor subunit TctC
MCLLRKVADMDSLQCNWTWFILLRKGTVRFTANGIQPWHTITLSVVICAALTTTKAAADYPDRPVRVIVPSLPGGPPDLNMRIIVSELTRQMGKQFVVDNRPGASGSIATEMIARAIPDGYTIGQGNIATLATNRSMLPKLPYDPDRDIQPVAQTALSPNILAVTLSLPVKSVQELIAYARKNPGKLLFASGGNGTSMHLAGELFKRMTSTQMTHVPYKGISQGVTDMIGEQVHLMFNPASSMGPYVRGGRVRGLAITSAKRSPSFPELPTVAESGVPNFEVVAWGGIIAPGGVSKTIVNRLNAEVNKALATSTVKEQFFAAGNDVPTGGTPEEFAAFIKREVSKWAGVIKDANIKAD